MSGNIFRRRPAIVFAMIVTALLFTSIIPCSGAEKVAVDGYLVVGESTVGYAVDGIKPVVSIKPNEKLVLGSAPKNIAVDLTGKTVVVKDSNLNVVPFDTLGLRDMVTVWRKDKKVFIVIAPKSTTDPAKY